jgi:alkenylglycerophosphocholine hydrolase
MRPGLNSPAGWALGLGLAFALLDWVAVWWRLKRLEWVCKPATLVAFVIAGALLAAGREWGWVAAWFVPALVFSLLGDILLMVPGERWFLAGLLAFLLAQITYIIGFNVTPPPLAAVVLLPLVANFAWMILRKLVQGLEASGSPDMRLPVTVYALVLTLMLFSAWATWFRGSWSWEARIAAGVGGSLFFASDLMLAWNRFVRRSRILHFAVIVTYHLAQLALVLVIAFAP